MALRRSKPLAPLAVSHVDSDGGSSTGSSPTLLTDSGKFMIGAFAIGKEGVVEQPAPPLRASAGGIDFADLRQLEVIGRGASGYVRRVEHVPTGRMMAVKEICISDPSRRHQILKEMETLRAATAASPSQSHLMWYEGVRYTEGSVQIAMMLMDGGSLGDLLQRVGPLPSDALAAITRQTLAALVELRERRLVHRDLKPQNILLTTRGHVVLSDFGCVAELQDSFGKCGTFVGTVPYMSPERIQGQEYGYASDIWALGLSLHECAVGHFPYDAKRNGYWGILQAVLKEPSPTLPSGDPRYPAALVDFVDQCLQKAPDDRPEAKALLCHAFVAGGGVAGGRFSLEAFLRGSLASRGSSSLGGESGHDRDGEQHQQQQRRRQNQNQKRSDTHDDASPEEVEAEEHDDEEPRDPSPTGMEVAGPHDSGDGDEETVEEELECDDDDDDNDDDDHALPRARRRRRCRRRRRRFGRPRKHWTAHRRRPRCSTQPPRGGAGGARASAHPPDARRLALTHRPRCENCGARGGAPLATRPAEQHGARARQAPRAVRRL